VIAGGRDAEIFVQLAKYNALDQKGKIIAEYIWLVMPPLPHGSPALFGFWKIAARLSFRTATCMLFPKKKIKNKNKK